MTRQLTILLAAFALFAPRAQASTAIELSVDELQAQAQVVVLGEVVEAHSYWDNGLIFTESTVEVIDCLEGTCGESVVVTTLGGEVGGIAQAVAGDAQYVPGQQVMAFLAENSEGRLMTVGMAQGVFHITRIDGVYVAQTDLSGLVLVDGPGMAPIESASEVYRLADLISAVRYRVPALPLTLGEMPTMMMAAE